VAGSDELPGLLTSADITFEAGITYRQLDHWVRRGYLRPEHVGKNRYGSSSGYSRYWTREELDVARVMGRLTAAGLTPTAAHRIARSGEPRAELAPGIQIEVAP
jgi:DNA-binding transcriptional MerR regulator